MTAFVYKWTHSSGKWYIGSRTAKGCHVDDGYICSSKTVKPMIKSNPTSWSREILFHGTVDEVRNEEIRLLQEYKAVEDLNSFNRSYNSGFVSSRRSSEGKRRMHKENVDIFVDKNQVQSFLELGWQLGYSLSTKDKMKQNHADVSGSNNPMYGIDRSGDKSYWYGKSLSAAHKNKLRYAKSEETKKKISNSNTGKIYGKREQVTCVHCGFTCGINTHARWHGNNCGHRVLEMAAELNEDKRVQKYVTSEVARFIKELKI